MNAGLLYREGTVAGASPTALVARLYEQAIEDLRQAVKALNGGDVELRSNRINHAILIVGLLQSQLNLDAGGKVAENLRNFYELLMRNLMEAQILQSKTLLAQQITDLLAVREAWIEVERAERTTTVAADLAPVDIAASAADAAHVDWKG